MPVELTSTIYPVCLPEISLDPEHLAGEFVHKSIIILWSLTAIRLGTIQILRNQNSGWVGEAKCLCLLTWWVGLVKCLRNEKNH